MKRASASWRWSGWDSQNLYVAIRVQDDQLIFGDDGSYAHPTAEFATDGQDVEPWGLVAGAGLTWLTDGGILAELKYAGELREDYQSHGVMAQIRITF